MRIAVVGPITGGSLSVAAAATRALRRLGHSVTFVNNARFAPDLAACKALPDQVRSRAEVDVFVRAAADTKASLQVCRPQVALYLAQAPVLSRDDLAPLHERNVPSVFWFVEDFRVFTYWQRAAPRFDHIWTIQGAPFPQLLAPLGVKSVDYVPLACEPFDGAAAASAGTVTFVGTGYPNRIERLAAMALPDLRLYGPLFTRDARLAPHVAADGALPHEHLAPLFAGSAINLNLSSSVDARAHNERKDFVNPRAFEICGSGGFQLADRLIPLEEFFEPETEVATFGSDDEARDKVRFFLAHETARKAVAQRGMARALSSHTYDVRLAGALERMLAIDGDRIAAAA